MAEEKHLKKYPYAFNISFWCKFLGTLNLIDVVS